MPHLKTQVNSNPSDQHGGKLKLQEKGKKKAKVIWFCVGFVGGYNGYTCKFLWQNSKQYSWACIMFYAWQASCHRRLNVWLFKDNRKLDWLTKVKDWGYDKQRW